MTDLTVSAPGETHVHEIRRERARSGWNGRRHAYETESYRRMLAPAKAAEAWRSAHPVHGGEGTFCSDSPQRTEPRNQSKLRQTCVHGEPGSVGNGAHVPAQEPTPTFALPAESQAEWVGAVGAVWQGNS